MNTETFSLYSHGVSNGKLRLLHDFAVSGCVLDVGCGNGLYGVHLAAMGCDVVQIDLADRRDNKASHLSFQQMNAQDLHLPDYSFDHVLAFDIMEHLDDDRLFLQHVHRVCRRTLFLSVPNIDDSQLNQLALTFIHHKDKTHRREYSRESLMTLLEQSGFHVLTIVPNYNTHLTGFALALANRSLMSRMAAYLISFQCRVLEKIGLFENRSIGDWFCVAEVV